MGDLSIGREGGLEGAFKNCISLGATMGKQL